MIQVGDKVICTVQHWETNNGVPDIKNNPEFNEFHQVMDMANCYHEGPTMLKLRGYEKDDDGTEQWFSAESFRPLDRIFAGSILHDIYKNHGHELG